MKKLMSIIISMVLGVMIAMPVSAAEAMPKEDVIEKEETKMWYYSNYDLFRMFLEEKETGKYTVYGG